MQGESCTGEAWKTPELAAKFLKGVRGAIPLAAEQIEIILRLARAWKPDFKSFLDLGCGDGVLGRALWQASPRAGGTFLDFSEAMLEAARTACGAEASARFIVSDFGLPGWQSALGAEAGFDIIVSGLAIHHQPDSRKKEIYTELFDLLAPGGLFLHLEHVASVSDRAQQTADDYFIDALYDFHSRGETPYSRDEIANGYFHRPDKAANILAPLETQLVWLRETGFQDVDCWFKVFELAVFGGRKP